MIPYCSTTLLCSLFLSFSFFFSSTSLPTLLPGKQREGRVERVLSYIEYSVYMGGDWTLSALLCQRR